MASIIPGYEYDIFISYRQKDNKGDKWVSVFVDALKTELESTFKEEISVYFDVNTHDGLLETHDVDASLKDKLKCLIFIPILSRTYCDPKSFAWEHEFKAFVENASNDQFGLKVRLLNNNVANRVLPVFIHDLDNDDTKFCESVLNGVLRGVEFIYKEPGVNRPLKLDDDEKTNINKTKYRNQINKVANAIKDIITAIGQAEKNSATVSKSVIKRISVNKNGTIKTIISGSILALALVVLGFLFIPKLVKSPLQLEKSIAVLPFENMSNEREQEYFSDGMMQEILNHLFIIGGLKIPSSTSSMRFKGSKLSVSEIARDLGVYYVLEGNVYKSGNNVRIIVRLISGQDERLLWSKDYNKTVTATNLLEIQSDVAQQVADNMKMVIDPEVKKRIEAKPTVNTEAYTLFLHAWIQYLPFEQAKTTLERAISLDPEYADAYALLGDYWIDRGAWSGDLKREQVLEKAQPLIEKALHLDKNSILAHTAMAELSLYYNWDFESVEKEYQIFIQLNPSNSDLIYFYSNYLLASGKFHEAHVFTENAFNLNTKSSGDFVEMALTYYYDNQPEKALETIETATQLFQDTANITMITIKLWDYLANYDKTIALFEKEMAGKNLNDLNSFYLGHIGIAYFKTGNRSKSSKYLNELLRRIRNSPVGSPSFFAAAIYTAEGENDMAIQLLEKGYRNHEVEMYWLKVEPLFRPLHGDQRFESILAKIGFK
jgi:TolB-like protein/lipoprotein NlpI